MLTLMVLIAAGFLTSSAACASPRRKVRGGHPLTTRHWKSKTHLIKASAAVLALGAVTLAIHLQLGASS